MIQSPEAAGDNPSHVLPGCTEQGDDIRNPPDSNSLRSWRCKCRQSGSANLQLVEVHTQGTGRQATLLFLLKHREGMRRSRHTG